MNKAAPGVGFIPLALARPAWDHRSPLVCRTPHPEIRFKEDQLVASGFQQGRKTHFHTDNMATVGKV